MITKLFPIYRSQPGVFTRSLILCAVGMFCCFSAVDAFAQKKADPYDDPDLPTGSSGSSGDDMLLEGSPPAESVVNTPEAEGNESPPVAQQPPDLSDEGSGESGQGMGSQNGQLDDSFTTVVDTDGLDGADISVDGGSSSGTGGPDSSLFPGGTYVGNQEGQIPQESGSGGSGSTIPTETSGGQNPGQQQQAGTGNGQQNTGQQQGTAGYPQQGNGQQQTINDTMGFVSNVVGPLVNAILNGDYSQLLGMAGSLLGQGFGYGYLSDLGMFQQNDSGQRMRAMDQYISYRQKQSLDYKVAETLVANEEAWTEESPGFFALGNAPKSIEGIREREDEHLEEQTLACNQSDQTKTHQHSFQDITTPPRMNSQWCSTKYEYQGRGETAGLCRICIPFYYCSDGCWWVEADLIDYVVPTQLVTISDKFAYSRYFSNQKNMQTVNAQRLQELLKQHLLEQQNTLELPMEQYLATLDSGDVNLAKTSGLREAWDRMKHQFQQDGGITPLVEEKVSEVSQLLGYAQETGGFARFLPLPSIQQKLGKGTNYSFGETQDGGRAVPHIVADEPFFATDGSSSQINKEAFWMTETANVDAAKLNRHLKDPFTCFKHDMLNGRSPEFLGTLLGNVKPAAAQDMKGYLNDPRVLAQSGDKNFEAMHCLDNIGTVVPLTAKSSNPNIPEMILQTVVKGYRQYHYEVPVISVNSSMQVAGIFNPRFEENEDEDGNTTKEIIKDPNTFQGLSASGNFNMKGYRQSFDLRRDRFHIFPDDINGIYRSSAKDPPMMNRRLIPDLAVIEGITKKLLGGIASMQAAGSIISGASSAVSSVLESRWWSGTRSPYGPPIPVAYHESQQCSLFQPLVHPANKWKDSNFVFDPEFPEHLPYGETSMGLYQHFSGCVGFKGVDHISGMNGGIPFWEIVQRKKPSVFQSFGVAAEMRLY